MAMSAQDSWEVPVVDALERERTLTVTVSDGRVAVVPPPGGGFYLPAQSVWQLHEAIRAAAIIAMKSNNNGRAAV
jgi:hypothetical protein